MTQETLPAPGLLRRLAAGFYDGLLIIAIWFLATALVLPLSGGEAIQDWRWAYGLYLLFLTGLFFVWFWHRNGQTLGMQAWRLRLVSHDQARPALRQLLLRAALMLILLVTALYGLAMLGLASFPDWLGGLCFLPLLLSMGWVLLDRQKQTLHDRLAGTRLILLPKRR